MNSACMAVGWDELADWWAGELASAREQQVEEHVLSCDACTRRAEQLAALLRGLADVARRGGVSGVATPGVLRRMEREGLRIHRYALRPGQVVPCSAWPEDDVLAAVLDVRGTGVGEGPRVDLVVNASTGLHARFEDVPVDRASGTVTWTVPAAPERAGPAADVRIELVRVADGEDVAVSAYTLEHRPWHGPDSPR